VDILIDIHGRSSILKKAQSFVCVWPEGFPVGLCQGGDNQSPPAALLFASIYFVLYFLIFEQPRQLSAWPHNQLEAKLQVILEDS
jgi:hypothetical protein